jgi:hypothetical protein
MFVCFFVVYFFIFIFLFPHSLKALYIFEQIRTSIRNKHVEYMEFNFMDNTMLVPGIQSNQFKQYATKRKLHVSVISFKTNLHNFHILWKKNSHHKACKLIVINRLNKL